jgi:hypothetical protein
MSTQKILVYGGAAFAVWWLFLRRPPMPPPVQPEGKVNANNPQGVVRGSA